MARSGTDIAYVTEYIDRRGPVIHDVFTVGSNFNESKSRYEAKNKHQEFMEALEEYGRIDGHNLDFNPAKCTWKEVIEELNLAHLAAYSCERRENTFYGKTRNVVNNTIQIVEPALDALPDHLCILQGGLAIVFNLVKRRERDRQRILDVFGHIPDIISTACNKSKQFPDDKKLHDLLDELKVTLFDTIPNLVDLLRPKTLLTKITNPFRGLKVEELLSCVQKRARLLEAHARELRDSLIFEIYHDTEAIKKTNNNVQMRVEEIHKSVSAVGQDVHGISAQYEKHEKRLGSRIDELQEFWAEQIHDALESQNGLFQMLKDVVYVFQHGEREPGLDTNRSLNSPPGLPSPQVHSFLVQVLDVRYEQGDRDLFMILRQTQEFDLACKTLLARVLANARFRRWITAGDSDLIYVEGRLDPSSYGRTSPVAYICANLVHLFQDKPKTMTLSFFCGQHVASNDDLQGPKGLIRSILAKLLMAWPDAPLSNVDLTSFQEDIARISIDVLCHTFEQVLGQAPSDCTLYLVIDDLAQFERDSWVNDYASLLSMLDHLVQNGGFGPRVMVLVTSPIRNRWLAELARSQTIELTERG